MNGVCKYYVWKDGEHADCDGFFDYLDALDFATEIDADEIEKTIWNTELAYQSREPADDFEVVWKKGE